MSLLIRRAVLDGKEVDILCCGGLIEAVEEHPGKFAAAAISGGEVLEADGMAVVPGLYNGHTHAAMSLLRGYADDMPLQSWLAEKIWPLEAKLTEEMVYQGARLACLEMIKSGTVFFNDMYWHFNGTARAVEEMGLRAALSAVMIDFGEPAKLAEQQAKTLDRLAASRDFSDRLQFVLGPHAIYTVSRVGLEWVRDFAAEHDLLIHLHLSETEQEVNDSVKNFAKRPLFYIDEIGLLNERLIAAHAVWLDDREIALFQERRARAVTNPVSNMKLAVGRVFPYGRLAQEGVLIGLGTDGCASNNNLDMFDSLKTSALLQKFADNDPTALPAAAAWRMATVDGAAVFGIDGGVVAPGKLADLLLIDTRRPELTPGHNLVSDLVYAASGAVVDSTVVAGRVLMKHRQVPGEAEIIAEARATVKELLRL